MRLLACACLLAGCVTIPAMAPAPPAPTRYFCRYALNPHRLQNGALHLPGDAAPFARFKDARKAGVELTIPHGERTDAMSAVFTTGWVTLRATYAPDERMPVSTKVALAVTPVLQFPAGAEVRLEGIDGDDFIVSLERPDELVGAVPLRARVACSDTSIGYVERSFPDEKADDGEGEDGRSDAAGLAIPAGAEVPFRERPDGPVLESFLAREDETPVRLLGEDGAWAKVRADAWPARLVGWVPRERLRPRTPREVGGLLGVLGGLGAVRSGDGRGTPDHPRCAGAAPLAVRVGARVQEIGQLNRNAAYVEVARGGGWSEIRLPELDWIRLEPGAAWLLSEQAAAACRTPQATGK